jgi:hypothetical protein
MHSAVFPQFRHRIAAVPRYWLVAVASAFAFTRGATIKEPHRCLSESRIVTAASDAHTPPMFSEARPVACARGLIVSGFVRALAIKLSPLRCWLTRVVGSRADRCAVPVWPFGLSVAGWSSGFSANRLVG